jgi:histidinol-phosphate phosphatase family protein
VTYDVVIPTAGRPSLAALLAGLAAGDGPAPERVIVVDDRPGEVAPLATPAGLPLRVLRPDRPGRGPAAARNAGWRAGAADWVVFLDDDVALPAGWRAALAADLAGCGPGTGGCQGRIVVPRPARATDWERNVAGLEAARWATADMAYRRRVLEAVGGFDERFPRAFREDADLGLRVVQAGHDITLCRRTVTHPVRPAPAWVSVAKQAGNADDALMRALHGRRWRQRAGVPGGRRPRHLAITAAGLGALAAAATGRRPVARALAAAWLAGTSELAGARIAPGPRTSREVATMAWSSAVLPVAATAWWLAGWAVLPRKLRAPGPLSTEAAARPAAVLFDRDGTLIEDVPYNGDPALVRPVPGARAALERLRAARVPTGVVSNQSGIARGLLTEDQVQAVNARVDELLGPLGPWVYCPHGDADDCECRKPRPGLVLRAARELGVDPAEVAVIGDIGADVEAARAAGARGILVPTPRTLREEVDAAAEVAPDLAAAVERVLR